MLLSGLLRKGVDKAVINKRYYMVIDDKTNKYKL